MVNSKIRDDANGNLRVIEGSEKFSQVPLETKVAVAIYFAALKNGKIKSYSEIGKYVPTSVGKIKKQAKRFKDLCYEKVNISECRIKESDLIKEACGKLGYMPCIGT